MSACVPARPGHLQNYSAAKKANCKRQNPNPAFGFDSKKKLARTLIRASSLEFVSYANLIAIVVMIPMVAVITVPAVPVRPIIAIVPVRSVVSVRVIAISVWVTVIVAVPVGWISESDSYAPNSH